MRVKATKMEFFLGLFESKLNVCVRQKTGTGCVVIWKVNLNRL